jgi:hypothetical protein
VTFEKADTKILFKGPNAPTDSRLINAQRASSEPEISPISDGDEKSKIFDIHDGR